MQAREILKFIFISNNKRAARRSAAEPAAWSQRCPCQCASDLDNRFFFSSIYMWKKNEVWTYLSCIWWTVLTTIIVCHLLFWDLWVRITTAVSRGWYPHFFLVFVQDSMNCPGVLWAASHCHSIKNDLDIFPTSSLVALCNVYVRLRIFTDRKQNHDKRRCLCLQSLGLYEVTLHKAMYQGQ